MSEPLPFYPTGPTEALPIPPGTCADCNQPLHGQAQPDPFGWMICAACAATYTEPPAMELGKPAGPLARIIAAVADKLTAAKEAALS